MEAFEWYKKVLTNYTVFTGRARRSEYWYFVLVNMIISLGLTYLGGMIHMPIIGSLYSLAVFLPSIAVGIRRMHDVGKSGWFILIPFYNLYLAVLEGDRGRNEYGPDPKNPELDDIADHLVD